MESAGPHCVPRVGKNQGRPGGQVHTQRAPSIAGHHRRNSCPEQDARVKGRGRRRVMDDRGTDREKKRKGFDFRAKVANFSAGSLKAKKLQHRMAGNSKMGKNVLTPSAVGKVF